MENYKMYIEYRVENEDGFDVDSFITTANDWNTLLHEINNQAFNFIRVQSSLDKVDALYSKTQILRMYIEPDENLKKEPVVILGII